MVRAIILSFFICGIVGCVKATRQERSHSEPQVVEKYLDTIADKYKRPKTEVKRKWDNKGRIKEVIFSYGDDPEITMTAKLKVEWKNDEIDVSASATMTTMMFPVSLRAKDVERQLRQAIDSAWTAGGRDRVTNEKL